MGILDIAAENNIRFRKPVSIVKKALEDMGKTPTTPIHIYDNYPKGWEGVVGVDDRVYVIESEFGQLKLNIEPAFGFYPNGLIRRKQYGGS